MFIGGDLCLNAIILGVETTLGSLSQSILDLLHDQDLQIRLQAEIDSQFEPTHTMTLCDE